MNDRRAAVVLAMALAAGIGLRGALADAPPLPLRVLGVLTCSLAPIEDGAAGDPGQVREGWCQFRIGDSGAEETYLGRFQLLGQERPPLPGRVIMLVVKTPFAKTVAPGLLRQTYSADVSAAGKQAILVGDRDNSIVLHPVAAEPAGQPAASARQSHATVMAAELRLQSSPG